MNHRRRYIPYLGWTIVLKKTPLGWFSRLEDGPYYRGAAYWLRFSWWWGPTYSRAAILAMNEAERAPRSR